MKTLFLFFAFLSFSTFSQKSDQHISLDHSSFSSMSSQNSLGIIVDMRYFTTKNFTMERVDGYQANACFLHKKVMENLKKVHKDLKQKGYGLYLFDCYRPQKGVDHFVRWSHAPDQPLSKKKYYPKLEKSVLFDSGYIAKKSGHSRGSTVDLSIYKLNDPKREPIDMGTPFDFFGPKSHTANSEITNIAKSNRKILLASMEKFGFQNYKKEWWHFTYKPEPTPKTYFNFDVSLDKSK